MYNCVLRPAAADRPLVLQTRRCRRTARAGCRSCPPTTRRSSRNSTRRARRWSAYFAHRPTTSHPRVLVAGVGEMDCPPRETHRRSVREAKETRGERRGTLTEYVGRPGTATAGLCGDWFVTLTLKTCVRNWLLYGAVLVCWYNSGEACRFLLA